MHAPAPDPRAEAVVDLAAVRANVAGIRAAVGDAEVMAVVKADAYGHGMLPCARAALDSGASRLAVALVDEALVLRAAGVDAPLLVLLPGAGRLVEAIAAGVELTAAAPVHLAALSAAAREAGRSARVHLEADTGLGRGGSTSGDWEALVRRALADDALEVTGLWSHFACADTPEHPSVRLQLEAFAAALGSAERLGVRGALHHLANSGGALAVPDARFDAVRPGIALYGLSPFADGDRAPSLRPVMTLRARVSLTKRLPAGHGVGYGLRHHTAFETTTAVVPLGYADGIPRAASGNVEVLLGGRRRRVVGAVSMDQVVVEVDDDPVAIGDEVLLFGPGDAGEPTADEWAAALGTIGYEVTTRIGPRVPRRHVEDRMVGS